MEHGGIKIEALPKERWKGVTIPLITGSDSYYDLEMRPFCAAMRQPTNESHYYSGD